MERFDGEEPRDFGVLLVYVFQKEAIRPDGEPGVDAFQGGEPGVGVELF